MIAPVNDGRFLKRQALALLEWTLDDLSPDHSLSLKCGFEREGHFIPDQLASPTADIKQWKISQQAAMDTYAARLQEKIMKDDSAVERIYHDQVGVFMLEGVTKTMQPLMAARAIERISDRMLNEGHLMGLAPAEFGSTPVGAAVDKLNAAASKIGINDYASKVFPDFKNEVFDVEGRGPCLIGRGQHCNLSIWSGDKNLFRRVNGTNGEELLHNATEEALKWLPHMFLPYRNGNYYRIHNGTAQRSYEFSATDLGGKKAGQVVRYTADRTLRSWKPDSFRLEFRQATPEADPYDVALATVAPLVHACDTGIRKVDGKAQFDVNGRPILLHPRGFPTEYHQPMPSTEEQAKALFNSPDNPYFAYLNELAERKLERVQADYGGKMTAANREVVRAAEKLRGIGTRLYNTYCEEYGIPVPDRVLNPVLAPLAAAQAHALR